MTKEDKELLFKDLCARLPYGVMCHYETEVLTGEVFRGNGLLQSIFGVGKAFIINGQHHRQESEVKPYLRPMSSMTEDEKELLKQEHLEDEKLYLKAIKGDGSMRGKVITHYAADWCDKNHFDYRGLIEKGLALEAPKDMYKI